jgi:hypothetical protein
MRRRGECPRRLSERMSATVIEEEEDGRTLAKGGNDDSESTDRDDEGDFGFQGGFAIARKVLAIGTGEVME